MLKNFDPRFALQSYNRPQARGRRQARLPGQKCIKKTAGTHLMSCTSTNVMFNLVYISSGIQNTVCKQTVPVAKEYLMKVLFTLY